MTIFCYSRPDKPQKLCILIDFDGFSIFTAPPMKTSQATLSILQNQVLTNTYSI